MRARQRNTRVRSEPNQQPCPVTARTKRPRHAQNGELGASRLQLGYNPADKHGGALYDLTLSPGRPTRTPSTAPTHRARTTNRVAAPFVLPAGSSVGLGGERER